MRQFPYPKFGSKVATKPNSSISIPKCTFYYSYSRYFQLQITVVKYHTYSMEAEEPLAPVAPAVLLSFHSINGAAITSLASHLDLNDLDGHQSRVSHQMLSVRLLLDILRSVMYFMMSPAIISLISCIYYL